MSNEKKVKGFAVMIENLVPFSNRGNKVLRLIKKLKGFTAVHPHYPVGNILIFDTKKNAEDARIRLKDFGVKVGQIIAECETDYEKGEVVIKGPVKD